MLRDFKTFVKKQALFTESDRLLLAVSGGVDSMVLVSLFAQTSIDFGIAHCNFKLRGEASDLDAKFVQNKAETLNIPFFLQEFDTKREAQASKKSIQVTARLLRYDWLEKIARDHHFQFIATAHHMDDSIETILYNWAKGSGIKGLLGVPLKNGIVIRPLLFADKAQILAYAESYQIAFREDASNQEDKYTRNKIRHSVVPLLRSINPNLSKTVAANIFRLKETQEWMQKSIQELEATCVDRNDHEIRIKTLPLQHQSNLTTPLHIWLYPYGFNEGQIQQIIKEDFCNVGAQFYSSTHQLLIDRHELIVSPRPSPSSHSEKIFIYPDTEEIKHELFSLKMKTVLGNKIEFNTDNFSVKIDSQKLQFPLILRHWKPGDAFTPLGMKGKKQKLQDFFSNRKINRLEKNKIWILENGDQKIIWVVGYRISEQFKIKESTSTGIRFSFNSNH